MKNSQIIKTDKFITDYSFIARVVPFDVLKKNPAVANIYCAIILKSLKNIQGSNEFHDFMHSNYGSNLVCRLNRFNEYFYLGIKFECLSKKYLPNNYDAFNSLVSLGKDVFFSKPVFNEELIERNKKELISYIKKNEKTPYLVCYKKALKQIDPTHPINFDLLGTVKQVEEVNIEKLYSFHEEISKYPLTYVYEGNNEFNQFELLKESFKDDFELPLYKDVPLKECKYIYNEETMESPNTNLIMIFKFDMPYTLKNSYIMHYFDHIFGGQNSILFNVIREELGLCYSISSTTYTTENIVEVSTQISKENVEKTIESIKEIVSNFDKYCSMEYFEKAKMDIVSEIIDRYDNPNDIFTHNLILLYKRNRISSYELSMETLNSVTYDEVLSFAKDLRLISTYVVKGEN